MSVQVNSRVRVSGRFLDGQTSAASLQHGGNGSNHTHKKKNKEDYRKASLVILKRRSLISNLTGSQRNLKWVFSLELRTFATYNPASLLKVDSLSFTPQL